jgi:molecular chaperone HscB
MPPIERPDTSNYFRFYGIEQSFAIDTAKLKTLFLEKSRQFHPDFYTHDPESQNIALAVSAFNNQGYKLLNNEISRAQYLVDLHQDKENEKQQLPNSFLMEMMDLNEAIDELGSSENEAKVQQLRSEIGSIKDETLSEIRRLAGEANWHDTQVALLKWRYLERLEGRIQELGAGN